MQTIFATVNLRRSLFAHIGRVIVHWAYLEHLLSETIFLASSLDPKIGRLTLQEPRAKERVVRIKMILEYRGVKVSTDLDKLFNEIKDIEGDRNDLAHGVWVRFPGEAGGPYLRKTSGNLDTAKLKISGKVPRKMLPEAVEYPITDVMELADKIKALAVTANQLRKEVKALLPPSRGTPQTEFPNPDTEPKLLGPELAPPPESSQE